MSYVSETHGGESVVTVKPRLLVCPECGAKMSSAKNALTTRDGHIFRERLCPCCQSVFFTRQEPERVTRYVMGKVPSYIPMDVAASGEIPHMGKVAGYDFSLQ